jgi:hypothetical protein
MADSDKLGLGLDDIIRLDRTTTNRRGARGGTRGFRARGGAGVSRGSNNFTGTNNSFRARGGGGIVNTHFCFAYQSNNGISRTIDSL